jgi:hypothetical protein
MNSLAIRVVAAVAACVAACAVVAQAGSGSDNGQRPPVTQDNVPPAVQSQAPPEPTKKECLTDKSGFRNRDGQSEFYVELINACDRALVCVVKAYVIGAEGGKAGSGTVQLAAALDGAEVHETWTMSTAQTGGMASVSRSCKFE